MNEQDRQRYVDQLVAFVFACCVGIFWITVICVWLWVRHGSGGAAG